MMSAFHLPESKNKVRTLCRMLLGINQQEDSVKENISFIRIEKSPFSR